MKVKVDDLKVVSYFIGMAIGTLAGGLFSRSQYHKGKADAYKEIEDDLKDMQEYLEDSLEEAKVKESE